MAQGQSNLGVGIVVDSAKALADLKLFGAQVQKLTADLRAAVKAGDPATVAAARQNLERAILLYQQQDVAVKKTTASFKEYTKAQAEAAAGNKKLELSLVGIKGGIDTIATGVRQLRYGIIAEIIREVSQIAAAPITNLIEKFDDLKRASLATGFDTSTIQAFQQVLKETNADADAAVKVLYSLGRAVSAARLEMERAGKVGFWTRPGAGGPTAVNIARGGRAPDQADRFAQFAPGGTAVLAPGRPPGPPEVKTQTDALLALNIHAERYNNTLEDEDRLLIDIGRAMEKMRAEGRTDYLGEITSTLLGKNARETLQTFKDIPERLKAVRAEQAKGGVALSEDDKRLIEAQEKIFTQVGIKREGMETRGALAALPTIGAGAQELLKGMGELSKLGPQIIQAGTDLGNAATTGAATVSKNFGEAATSLTDSFGKLGAAANEAIANLPTLIPPTVDPGAFAGGGHVRGAGSGTSDSILARLSNGEFVINAASTRRLGTSFLSGLNNYAMGGFVGAPPMRFAAGGLASAGGGTPVHLHLGGHVFATTASSSVASALVSEAHRQAVTSAGVKPSWFAARPGGR